MKMLGPKGILTPFDTRLLRALHSRNPQKHSPFGTFSSNERKNF